MTTSPRPSTTATMTPPGRIAFELHPAYLALITAQRELEVDGEFTPCSNRGREWDCERPEGGATPAWQAHHDAIVAECGGCPLLEPCARWRDASDGWVGVLAGQRRGRTRGKAVA